LRFPQIFAGFAFSGCYQTSKPDKKFLIGWKSAVPVVATFNSECNYFFSVHSSPLSLFARSLVQAVNPCTQPEADSKPKKNPAQKIK
jgi:hypothetical protein